MRLRAFVPVLILVPATASGLATAKEGKGVIAKGACTVSDGGEPIVCSAYTSTKDIIAAVKSGCAKPELNARVPGGNAVGQWNDAGTCSKSAALGTCVAGAMGAEIKITMYKSAATKKYFGFDTADAAKIECLKSHGSKWEK